jgi:hypothetical protein
MHTHVPPSVKRHIRLATGIPGALALGSFYLAQVTETAVAGMAFMTGLSGLIVAAVWGPYIHWSWRTRHLEELHEDAVADLLFTVKRNRADLDAQNLVIEHLRRELAAGGGNGWVPDGPPSPRPPLSLVRAVKGEG